MPSLFKHIEMLNTRVSIVLSKYYIFVGSVSLIQRDFGGMGK